MKLKTQELVKASMFAALICVSTMIIHIPSPLRGYVNLGDCMVLLAGWLLLPQYSFLAAGIGSALADIFSGYMIYALATFIIKGLMAITVYYSYRILSKKINYNFSKILTGLLAELLMIVCYWLFESMLYGPIPSLAKIPANSIQGIFGITFGYILINIFERNKKSLCI